MSKLDFKSFSETLEFKKFFVFKGFSEDSVHYLPSRLYKGPSDGSNPVPVAIPFRSITLPVNKRTLELERELSAINFQDPEGEWFFSNDNKELLNKALIRFLVD